nr:hypothetical protein [Tanacetum cinerariifolium]
HSPQSYHHGNEDELVGNRYVLDWELCNDLRVCTPRACKELISHLATPAEDEFLGNLSKAEVLSQAYQTLGQTAVAQGELLKRHEYLNHEYVDLRNHSDANLVELDSLRSNFQRVTQDNEEKTQKIILLENAHFGCPSREKELLDMVKDFEKERDGWRATASDQVEKIRSLEKDLEPRTQPLVAAEGKIKALEKSLAGSVQLCFTAEWLGGHGFGRTEEAIGQILSETEKLDIEGSKSWEAKHRELFSMSYPYVEKIVAFCDLPISELLKVSPDVPLPPPEGETFRAIAKDVSQPPPAYAS